MNALKGRGGVWRSGGARLAQMSGPLRVAVVVSADQVPVHSARHGGRRGERPAELVQQPVGLVTGVSVRWSGLRVGRLRRPREGHEPPLRPAPLSCRTLARQATAAQARMLGGVTRVTRRFWRTPEETPESWVGANPEETNTSSPTNSASPARPGQP